MFNHLSAGSPYRPVLALLRAGHAVETDRAVLEVLFGSWSVEPEVCEDGCATLLVRLPSGLAAYLTRTGDLLVIDQAARDGVLRAQLFTGSAEALWCTVAEHYPDLVPGRGALPRYWVLREDVSPMVSTYATFDLLCFEIVERAVERDVIARRVEAANSALRPDARAA